MLKDFLKDHSRKNELLKETYKLIHQHGPISKISLIEKAEVKPTTMTRTIEELLENKWIQEGGVGESSGGRPPILYKINESAAWIIGLDISRMTVRIVLTNLHFTILERHSITMTVYHSPDVVFKEVNMVIEKWLEQHRISVDQLLGIGVGAVGPIHRGKGLITNPESFLAPGWERVNVIERLAQFSVLVLVDNGANSAAVAEYVQHNEMYSNILYCISGFGIRGGVVSDGKVLYSNQGDTSAFGHVIVQANGKVCLCGREGCLSAYATFGAMVEEFGRMRGLAGVTFDQFLKAVQSGDTEAVQAAKKASFYYGVGLANMINILRPELVVLHGSLIYDTSFFFEDTVRHTLEHAYIPDTSLIKFKKGSLREDGISLGGAIQVFQSNFREP